MIKKVSILVGLFGALAPLAHATSYTMEATVASSVTDLLSSYVSTIFSVIPTAIGIIGTLAVTLFGIRWLVGFARGHMHG
jgi:hypothetical protein